jgi:TonB family protein
MLAGLVVLVWTCGPIVAQEAQAQVTMVKLETPTYPPIARAARVSGEVGLDITLAPDGTANTVEVESGPAMLRQAAVDSATRSRFRANVEKPAGTYRVIYRFVLDDTMKCGDQRDGSYPHVKYEGNEVSIAEQAVLLCDPGAVMRYRSVKCLYLWKCGSKT